MSLPDHYRYTDVLNDQGLHLICNTYQSIKETECGYYVVPISWGRLDQGAIDSAMANKRAALVRFVLKVSTRRYCYPDKAEALRSYGHRKAAQHRHAFHALARSKHALAIVNEICALGNGYPVCKHTGAIEIGMPEEFKDYVWYV